MSEIARVPLKQSWPFASYGRSNFQMKYSQTYVFHVEVCASDYVLILIDIECLL